MIETKVKIDNNVQEELNQKPKTISIICMLIGTLGLIVYIILSVVLDPVPVWVDFLLIFSAFLGVGIVEYFVVARVNKLAAKDDANSDVKLTFYEDYYIIEETKNNEEIGKKKIFYKDIGRVRETKNYLFIQPAKSINAFNPVNKNLVSAEELSQIKEYLKAAKGKKK